MRKLTFVEMFSGIRGFGLGLKRAGWRCLWANDWDKYANKISKKRFLEGELIEGDIREVDAKTVPDHTLLTAGFPCQAFSVAGKRKGFKNPRGTLFYDIARVAKAKRPPLLLLENVKGLLSHNEGLTFQVIIESLDELGYLIEWQVLNSKHYGVPQNRERVFIVGHLRGTSSKQIFPIRPNGEVSSGKGECEPESGEEASTLEASYGKSKSLNNMVLAGALTCGAHSGGLHSQMTVVGVTLANTSRYNQGVNQTAFKQDRSSYALNSAGDQGILQNAKIRRLTPTECERLQGFPDGWTEGVSDTQRYKLLGNAVTVNVIEFLGVKLRNA